MIEGRKDNVSPCLLVCTCRRPNNPVACRAVLFCSFWLSSLGGVVCDGPEHELPYRGHVKYNMKREGIVARSASAIAAHAPGLGPAGLPALRVGMRLRGGASVTIRLEVRTSMQFVRGLWCARTLSCAMQPFSAIRKSSSATLSSMWRSSKLCCSPVNTHSNTHPQIHRARVCTA